MAQPTWAFTTRLEITFEVFLHLIMAANASSGASIVTVAMDLFLIRCLKTRSARPQEASADSVLAVILNGILASVAFRCVPVSPPASHVRTSPYYPQSNGKMERWFKTLEGECIRVKTPLSLEDARWLVAEFVARCNTVRLHSAIGYVTPADKLAGREEEIWTERKRKLAAAEARRRTAQAQASASTQS